MRETKPRWPFFDLDGEECCDHEAALAQLLAAGVLFANNRPYSHKGHCGDDPTLEPDTIVLFVVANDIWFWASADAENLTMDEVGPLYKAWKEDERWGVVKWLCRKRNLKPQVPVIESMRRDGAWTEDLEAMPSPSPS